MALSDTSRHHPHGDLKAALVKAGMELLAEGDLSGLTLRKCAARAGVSHAAPAHHFEGLKGLVTAIVTEGFKIFTRAMTDYRKAATNDPRARLAGVCEGYLAFARENEAMATLMFMKSMFDTNDPDFQLASSASYQVLADACQPFKPGPGGAKGTETLIWSLVQGYASLARSGMVDESETPFADLLPMLDLKEA
jgi:AcrR family transcriptional regulator